MYVIKSVQTFIVVGIDVFLFKANSGILFQWDTEAKAAV